MGVDNIPKEGSTASERYKSNQRQYTKVTNADRNPCMKESEISLKCLEENFYDKDKCGNAFKNYRNCLNFWKEVQRERRRKGITPLMPPAEEREQIKIDRFGTK